MPHLRQANLAEESYKIFIPEEYLADFEVNHIENKPEEWVIELVEKEERIPKAQTGKEAVLDGYCNEIDILTVLALLLQWQQAQLMNRKKK